MAFYSKSTLHIQRILSWMRGALEALGPEWVKIVNPGPGASPFPGRRILVRFWSDDWDRAAIGRRAEGGREYARRQGPRFLALGYGNALELPNEPDVNSPQGIADLVAFTIAAVIELAGMGIPACIGCISVGNPHDDGTGNRAVAEAKMRQLAPMFLKRNYPVGVAPAYWSYHGYWSRLAGVGPENPYYALAYRWMVAVLVREGFDPLACPLLLSECGSDGQIRSLRGPSNAGWRLTGDEQMYLTDALTFEREVRKDAYVQAAMYFTAGYEQPWGSFDHTEDTVRKMRDRISPLGALLTPPPAPSALGTPEHPIQEPPIEIVGRCLQPAEFAGYVAGLTWPNGKPREIFLHHTYIPTVADWVGMPTILGMKNYYEQQLWQDDNGLWHEGWNAGPHLFAAPDGIWLFSPLEKDGVHAKGYNHLTLGLEMVGNYDAVRPTGAVLENTLAALATLFQALGLSPQGLRFHRDVSTKTCPGLAVTKEWIIPLIEARMVIMNETFLRNWAYNALRPYPQAGLPYNPTFAFPAYATREGLGVPLALATDKVSYGGVTYAVAAFALGIVYCPDGDWAKTKHITW